MCEPFVGVEGSDVTRGYRFPNSQISRVGGQIQGPNAERFIACSWKRVHVIWRHRF